MSPLTSVLTVLFFAVAGGLLLVSGIKLGRLADNNYDRFSHFYKIAAGIGMMIAAIYFSIKFIG